MNQDMVCMRVAIAGLTMGVFVALNVKPLAAQEASALKGKTITYIVATTAGGGYDAYGRVVAEHLQKHIAGSTVIVRNAPGGGHIIGANMIYASKPDGLTIGTFNTGLLYSQLAEQKAIRFDLRTMSWIGKAASIPRTIVITTRSPIKTFDDIVASRETLNFATSGLGSSGYAEISVLTKLLNLPIRLLTGYNSFDDQAAMRRGEVVGTIASRSAFEPFVRNGYGRFVAQFGRGYDDTPQMSAIVRDEKAQSFIRLMETVGQIAQFTAGPPKMPPHILEELRVAYRKAMDDEQLQAFMLRADLPRDPAFGDAVKNAIAKAMDQPPEVIALIKHALNAQPPR